MAYDQILLESMLKTILFYICLMVSLSPASPLKKLLFFFFAFWTKHQIGDSAQISVFENV
jgi:hypothetical protein